MGARPRGAADSGAFRIGFIYAIAAIAWIWLSDLILHRFIAASETAYWLSLAKGLVFVVVTAALLFLLIRREFRAREGAFARLRALVAASPVAILTLRDDGAGLTSWNAAAESLFGWEGAGSAAEKEQAADQLLRLVREGPRGRDGGIDTELERTKGGRATVRAFVSRLSADAEGDWLVMIEDRTSRVELERQLMHAQKMEAVGRLAGGIAHDFNNLITVMLGNADLALELAGPDSELRPDLEEVRRSAERASRLTSQLLVFSRRSPEVSVLLDINHVVQGVLGMLERIIGEDVRLRMELANGLPPVKADAGRIEQVIMNLAVNARDAMPMGGTLLIQTRRVTVDDEAAEASPDIRAGDYVVIAVTDTGIGMDEATQARAFEPFFTTKAEGKGTGLGLSSIYGIAKAAGGHVTLHSRPGRGTTITVGLPAHEAPVTEE